MAGAPLILVIEESSDILEQSRELLTHEGYQVAGAPDGEVGLALAAELHPSLILLEVMLPDLNGLELLERLPREVDGPPPPVIAMSGFDAFEREALSRGARAFLRKPVHREDLLAAVEAVLAGEALEASALLRQAGKVAERRRRASERREELLAKVDLCSPELQESLDALVQWCAGYFDIRMAFVNVERAHRIHFQAGVGGAPELLPGMSVEPEQSLCSLVIGAGGPLLLTSPAFRATFAVHPALVAGFRFYAGVPVKTPDGTVLGSLCVFDRKPHLFHGEDLLVLESLADGVGHRISATAGLSDTRVRAFVTPGVFTREVLHTLVAAELRRTVRSGGAVELAQLELGAKDEALYRRCAQAIVAEAGQLRLAIAEYAPGVLSVLIGAGAAPQADERMQRAIVAAREAYPGLRGVGIAAVRAPTSLLIETRGFEAKADEARLKASERGRGAIERVVVSLPPEPSLHP